MKNLILENRKVRFNYHLLEVLTAGLILKGSEVKSILKGDSSISEGYCYITPNGEIFVKGFTIQQYSEATYNNHNPKDDKKLLLNKKEIEDLSYKMETNQGLTIIPTKLFVADNGKIKIEIALCRGKKQYDKRVDKKLKDIERENQRKF